MLFWTPHFSILDFTFFVLNPHVGLTPHLK